MPGSSLAHGAAYLQETGFSSASHHEDINRLVGEGHTAVVIEHHMAFAAEAGWILDLGLKPAKAVARSSPKAGRRKSSARKNPAPRHF
jgi:hypothetical protein